MTRPAASPGEDDVETTVADPGPQVAIVVYPGVSELDVGLMLGLLTPLGGPNTAGTPDAAALTVARTRGSLLCAAGLVCTPQLIYAAAPPALAGVLIPGGLSAQKVGRDPATRAFLARARAARLPIGVVGGGLLLAGESGLLGGRAVGCPAALADTVWGYSPDDVRPGETVSDTPEGAAAIYSGPGGLGTAPVVLALISRLWGDEQAQQAAARVGLP